MAEVVCKTSAGGTAINIASFVPPEDVRPLYISTDDESDDKAVSPTFHVRRWGSVHIDNSFPANRSAAAKAAVASVRRWLGLPELTVQRFFSSAPTQAAAEVAVVDQKEPVIVEVDAAGEAHQLEPQQAGRTDYSTQELDALVRVQHADSQASPLAAWERKLLLRRWLRVHAEETDDVHSAVCATVAAQDMLRVPAHARNAMALADVAIKRSEECGSDMLCAISHLRTARTLLEGVSSDPYLSPDPHMPLVHLVAVYVPIWAPMIMPLLIALVTGIKELCKPSETDKKASKEPEIDKPAVPAEARFVTLKGSGRVLVRPYEPSDMLAIRSLMFEGQASHAKSAASFLVHMLWTKKLFTSDFQDIRAHYGTAGDAGPTRLWVALVDPRSLRVADDANPILEKSKECGSPLAGMSKEESRGFDERLVALSQQFAKGDKGELALAEARKLFRLPEKVPIYVDAQQWAIVGCVAAKPFDEKERAVPLTKGTSAYSSSDTAELKRMCVHAAARGRGVATALASNLEQWVHEHGFKRVYLTTLASMTEATSLYKKMGYAPPAGSPAEGHSQTFKGIGIRVVEFEKQL